MMAEPAPPNQTLSFLDLPAELRREIYTHLFKDSIVRVGDKPRQQQNFTWTNVLARNQILLTCRTCHAEAAHLFYSLSTWQIPNKSALVRFARYRMFSDAAPHVRRVHLASIHLLRNTDLTFLPALEEVVVERKDPSYSWVCDRTGPDIRNMIAENMYLTLHLENRDISSLIPEQYTVSLFVIPLQRPTMEFRFPRDAAILIDMTGLPMLGPRPSVQSIKSCFQGTLQAGIKMLEDPVGVFTFDGRKLASCCKDAKLVLSPQPEV